MKNGLARVIFTDINDRRYSDDEKFEAIKTALNFSTHNGITKAEMLEVIEWLINKHEVEA